MLNGRSLKPRLPWRCLIVAGIAFLVLHSPARAAQFTLSPSQTMVGSIPSYYTQQNDTLLDVQRVYDVGYAELIAANQAVNPWLPGSGTRVVIPTEYILPPAPRTGVVINLGERRIYYFHQGGKAVDTFPIGLGVDGKETPVGTTTIVAKEKQPAWYPPPSIHEEDQALPTMVPPGPDNPLGEYALRLGWKNFLIHGTNKPDGIGRNVSHGCVHLYPEDIERLFAEVPIGTTVRVVDQSVLVAWSGGRLYVAVHPTEAQTDEIDDGQPMTVSPSPALTSIVAAGAGDRRDLVDWQLVERAGRERTGIPVAVTPAALGVDACSAGSC